jgi:hypothetical protein
MGNGGTQLKRVPEDLVVRVVTTNRFDKVLISLGRVIGRREISSITLCKRRIAMAQQNPPNSQRDTHDKDP